MKNKKKGKKKTKFHMSAMKHLTTVLVLVLASTNASKYLRPESQIQQDPITGNVYQEVLPWILEENRFLSRTPSVEEFTANKWESPPDTRMVVLPDLDSLENLLQEDPDDVRMKRMKTSLSIDNPLDVLRQQYYRALARRMKYKSIEKNREHLIKTGKRSAVKDSVDYRLQLAKASDFSSGKSSPKNYLDNGESERYSVAANNGVGVGNSNDRNTGSSIYKSRLDEHSYQT